MSNKKNVTDLIDLVQKGEVLGAFEQFYAPEVAMQENGNPPTVGKDLNRTREEQFVASIAELHEVNVSHVLVDGDLAVIGWQMDYTDVNGIRLRLDQLALQTWKDGLIVQEKFYYDSASVVQNQEALAA